MRSLLYSLISLYILVILVNSILSFVRPARGGALEAVQSLTRALTEPVLGPVRRALLMARAGNVGIDFSPIVVIFALIILQGLIA